ncbi:MAG: hypothetical protein PHC28_09280 [Flavobacterium sp.]|uniref:hypothetical protein n=1 Tax=Flavobacterium sp. TaxID=239 RepID=UPI00262F7811|nr:hypothetical protein [Flavobacterium sp.]MDD5150661.1 hypothetical protein [Flavobacterium sp.]
MKYDIETFLNCASREEARSFLMNNCKTKNDLVEFAIQSDTFYFNKGARKEVIIESIIAQTIGARLNHQAILDMNS